MNGLMFGGIEGGGSKFVCAVGTGPADVRAQMSVPTTRPEETLDACLRFLAGHQPLAAMGIATFGPVDLDRASPTWGFTTTTPKPGWANVDLAGRFRRALGVPVAFDTDVNGAAIGEHRWGAGRDCDPFVYLTVGTGVGGGAVVNGRPVHGLAHPEMGHVRVPRDRSADPFPGTCPYHGDCLEGLASGPAMARRWGVAPETLPLDHPGWDLEAEYLALGLVAVVAILSPARIAVGGGVMASGHLLPRVRSRVVERLAGYLRAPAILTGIDAYIVPPALGDRVGVLGAIALAADAAVAAP
ncbi:MAG TPA: ROK family protein [Candidatus Binatia bacterium]|nr:ROK family protein [Candidatus Binatia bacterium]